MQYIAEQIVEPPFLPGDVVLYGNKTPEKLSITHASISLEGGSYPLFPVKKRCLY
jgi:cell wall-associated NlpC family hydrolase